VRAWLPYILVGIVLAVAVIALDWWALDLIIDAMVTPARAEPSENLRQLYAIAACVGAAAFGLLPYIRALVAVSVLVNAPAMFVVMCLHDPAMAELLHPMIDVGLLPSPVEAVRTFSVALGAEAVGAVSGQFIRLLILGKLKWLTQSNRAF